MYIKITLSSLFIIVIIWSNLYARHSLMGVGQRKYLRFGENKQIRLGDKSEGNCKLERKRKRRVKTRGAHQREKEIE